MSGLLVNLSFPAGVQTKSSAETRIQYERDDSAEDKKEKSKEIPQKTVKEDEGLVEQSSEVDDWVLVDEVL